MRTRKESLEPVEVIVVDEDLFESNLKSGGIRTIFIPFGTECQLHGIATCQAQTTENFQVP
jgi:hypothetical protein